MPGPFDGVTVDRDFSRRGTIETRQQVKQRRFSAAGRPYDANKFPLFDFKVNVLQRRGKGAARIRVAAKDAAQGDAFFS